MTNGLPGRLAAPEWEIPRYARDFLWLEGAGSSAKTTGEAGLFTLENPSPWLTLRWSAPGGPALARFSYEDQADLGWEGAVAVGGYVDALHITEVPRLDFPIALIFVGGQPLKPGFTPYPPGHRRGEIPYLAPDFYTGLAADVPSTTTPWLVAEASPLTSLAQDAMLNNLRLYLFGHLAADGSNWEDHFALPILLEAVTLFSP